MKYFISWHFAFFAIMFFHSSALIICQEFSEEPKKVAPPISVTYAQDNWAIIGDVEVFKKFNDLDNGDGANDGAIFVQSSAHLVTGLGILYEFGGQMAAGETYDISTVVYNTESSYFKLKVQLFNKNDGVVLVESSTISITGNVTVPVTSNISYTALSSDNNDTLQLRYVRVDDGHKARKFAIDLATINGNTIADFDQVYLPGPKLDIPLIASTSILKTEMDQIETLLETDYLTSSAPTAQQLSDAVDDYNSLNIVITNGKITGNAHVDRKAWDKAAFLKVFAQQLKHDPNDAAIKIKASNTVWLFAQQFYEGTLPYDYITYAYKLYAKPALYLKPYLSSKIQKLFEYTLYKHSLDYAFFWNPDYIIGAAGTKTGAINMDDIGNISDIQLTYCLKWQSSENERLRWTKGFKRFYERFMSFSPGTCDGIKVDGSGFHHFSALNNYTYNYNTPMRLLFFLKNTSFQVSKESYKVFRKGVYTQYFLANDNVEALSMAGRHPETRRISPNYNYVREFAFTGGNILGLGAGSYDPLLAGAYVRQWGPHVEFPGQTAEALNGFTQFNNHTSAVYWKNNWMAVARGATRWGFGAEMIGGSTNVYGRWQSYGALEIIYTGGENLGNGFKYNGWNWNYNPGATSIVAPWDKMKSEQFGQKEYQSKNFTGSLAFENKNHAIYSQTMGSSGMFATDFQEVSVPHGSDQQVFPFTHNPTFRFKKSKFFFDDMIISLGSNINNNDTENNTATTLYQRLSENVSDVKADNIAYTAYGTTSLSLQANHWIIDNFKTGFYLPSTNDSIKLQREQQQIPFYYQFDSSLRSGNPKVDYSIGFIDHGKTPVDADYEYIVVPSATATRMQTIATQMSVDNTRLYHVLQKDADAHILKYHPDNITAYALFNSVNEINTDGLLKSNSHPCLVMIKPSGSQGQITLALVNPDLGLEKQQYLDPNSVVIKLSLKGAWQLDENVEGVKVDNEFDEETSYEFTTKEGLPIEITLSPRSVTHIIESKAMVNGTIEPVGLIHVEHKKSLSFAINPNDGYEVNQLFIDGITQEATLSYQFVGVIEEHTIEATFKKKKYNVSFLELVNGSVDPQGPLSIEHGSSPVFDITPIIGYEVSSILINGVAIEIANKITIGEISKDTLIEIKFEKSVIVHTVVLKNNTGGRFSIAGDFELAEGQSKTIEMIPDEGFFIQEIKIDGLVVSSKNSIVISNIQKDIMIEVVFATLVVSKDFSITIEANDFGSVFPATLIRLNEGADQTITFTPNKGFQIKTVFVNGVDVGAVATYDVVDVQKDHHIKVVFAEKLIDESFLSEFYLLINEEKISGVIEGQTISIKILDSINQNDIISKAVHSGESILIEGQPFTEQSVSEVDLSKPINITVIAKDKTEEEFVLLVEILPDVNTQHKEEGGSGGCSYRSTQEINSFYFMVFIFFIFLNLKGYHREFKSSKKS